MLNLVVRNIKQYSKVVILSVVTLFLNVMVDLWLPTLNADISNNGMARGDVQYIIKMGAVMIVAVFIGVGFMIASSYFSSLAATGLGKNMRYELYCHVETLSKGDIDSIGTASLITRATNDVTQVQNATMMILRFLLMAPIMCIGGLVMAFKCSSSLAWVILFGMPFIALLMFYMIKKGLPLFKTIQKKIDWVNQVMREYLSGIRVIRAFIKDDYEVKRFDEANIDLKEISLKVNRMMAQLGPILMLIVNATNIAIVWVGGHYMVNGIIAVGDLSAFFSYVAMILMSMMMMSMMFIMIPRAQASAERINEVLSMNSAISDIDKPLSPKKDIHGEIEFENVSFVYPGAEEAVLSNISFKSHTGQTTAIIGGTGSGKSTLINLIPRFFDVTEGAIKLDGVDIREMDQEELRSRIGMVPQKSFLFSGTIEDNIRFGKEDATDEEIAHALEVAQASDFVGNMEDGIKSIITQGGTNVSGGQRQRLSIARALVRRPEVYIFDDSFSALDFKTDAALRKALDAETVDSTVIIVAQRVSTIMNADRIIVLDEGTVAGIGTHKELMENCSVYKEIVSSQLSESEVGNG